MSIRVACSGFPIAKSKYAAELSTVELKDMFDRMPRRSTLEALRETAPRGFEFVVCAPRAVLDLPKSAFAAHGRRPIDGPEHHYHLALDAARLLRSRLILFKPSPQVSAHPDSMGRLVKFFQSASRGDAQFVLEPPSSWPETLIERLAESARLTIALNPLGRRPPKRAPLRYYRIGDEKKTRGVHSFTDSDLRAIHAACDKPLNYVVFNNGPAAFATALRFAQMTGNW